MAVSLFSMLLFVVAGVTSFTELGKHMIEDATGKLPGRYGYEWMKHFSIDTGTLKPDGTPWDLEDDRDFKMLKMWRKEEKPVLLCGSPPCNAFSKIQTWNRSRMKPGTEEKLIATGLLH